MSKGRRDELVDRLSNTLRVSLPRFLRAANTTGGIVSQMQAEVKGFDHLTRIKALFRLWAPLYESYWKITNHETATDECVRQLEVGGRRKEDRVFNGRGLDLGTGPALVPFLIGRLKERAILDEMRDNPDGSVSDKSRRIADQCRKLQFRVKRFLLERDPSFIEGDLSTYLIGRLLHDVFRDLNTYPVIAQLEQYRRLKLAIDSGAKVEALASDPTIQNLVFCYIQDAMIVSRLIDIITPSGRRENRAFMHDFRLRLNDAISITGVDICPEMLEVGRRRAGSIFGARAHHGMFVEADALALPNDIATTEYDFITISQLIHLLPDDVKKTLLGICGTLLKRDGKLIIIDEWNPTFVGSSLLSFGQHQPITSQTDLLYVLSAIEVLFQAVFHPIDKRKMREIIHNAGFIYSTKRASWPIDDVPETLHVQSAHVYLKARKREGAIPNGNPVHEDPTSTTD